MELKNVFFMKKFGILYMENRSKYYYWEIISLLTVLIL